jgi:hypothetical protein
MFNPLTIPFDFRPMFLGFADLSSESAGTRRIFTPLTFKGRTLVRGDSSLLLVDKHDKPLNGQLAIAVLRARFLRRNRDSQRSVNYGYGGRNLINMLAARSARTRKMLIEIVSAECEFLQAIS